MTKTKPLFRPRNDNATTSGVMICHGYTVNDFCPGRVLLFSLFCISIISSDSSFFVDTGIKVYVNRLYICSERKDRKRRLQKLSSLIGQVNKPDSATPALPRRCSLQVQFLVSYHFYLSFFLSFNTMFVFFYLK